MAWPVERPLQVLEAPETILSVLIALGEIAAWPHGFDSTKKLGSGREFPAGQTRDEIKVSPVRTLESHVRTTSTPRGYGLVIDVTR